MVNQTSLWLVFIMAFFCSVLNSNGQQDTATHNGSFPDTLNKKRLTGVIIAQSTVYAGAITGLSALYYKDYKRSSFYFYNDNDSWLQMDKMGHVFASYYLSQVMHLSYRWAGVERRKAILFGSLLSYTFQLNIEILDGISSKWGFSWGDIAANTAGCLLFAGQQLAWDEQRFVVKYSWHPTDYSQYNPNILGSTVVENLWEDYNGMTFWLSGNISSFLPEKSKFPKWLNVAFGYGGEGLAANTDQFLQYRQFFFSLDVDLTRIPTRSKSLKALFAILNLIKIPCPSIEYNTLGQFRFYYIYF